MKKNLIKFIETSELPTKFGHFKVHAFTEILSNKDHLAITIGNLNETDSILSNL